MVPGVVRLEADGLDPLTLDDTTGIIVTEFDLGFPEVRGATDARPDTHGDDDSTSLFGARAVSITAFVDPPTGSTRRDLLDQVAAFFRLGLSTYVYWDDENDGVERRIRVRIDQHRRPINGRGAAIFIGLRAPDGLQESAAETVQSGTAEPDAGRRRLYPLTYPRTYPAANPAGVFTVTNVGNVETQPVLRLYGPATDPRIENQTTGEALEFTANGGVVLLEDEFLEIDVRERTVRVAGDAAQSRYNRLDIPASSWWELVPGVNRLRYYPVAFEPPAYAEIRFRSAWL